MKYYLQHRISVMRAERLKHLFITILLIGTCSCKANYELIEIDKPNLIGLKSNQIKGTIFKCTYPFDYLLVSDVDSTKRYTPTKEDIAEAEEILEDQIRDLNKKKPNQFRNCPVIHRNLNSYFRQYVGFYDDKGDKIIHINFLWDKYSLKDRIVGNADNRASYNDDYTVVFDGCSYYWQVNINLTTDQATDLAVNGVG